MLGLLLASLAIWLFVQYKHKGDVHFVGAGKIEPLPLSPYQRPAAVDAAADSGPTVLSPTRMTTALDLNSSTTHVSSRDLAAGPWPKRRPSYAHLSSQDSTNGFARASSRPEQGPSTYMPVPSITPSMARDTGPSLSHRPTSSSSGLSHHLSQRLHPPQTEAGWPSTPPLDAPPMHDVYVVHHDAGAAPVTVYTRGGARVTELPPGYRNITHHDSSSTSVARTGPQLALVGEPESPGSPLSLPPMSERKSSFRGSASQPVVEQETSRPPLPSPVPSDPSPSSQSPLSHILRNADKEIPSETRPTS